VPHIFISYAKKDTRLLAEALDAALKALPGVTAWMDSSLEADDSWTRQIEENIDRADYVIVLLSPDVSRPVTATQRRSFVLNEIDYALEANKTVLPVMVQRTRTPVAIAGTQYIDLTATPDDPAKIVARVRRRFNIPDETPVPMPSPVTSAPNMRRASSIWPLLAIGLIVAGVAALLVLNAISQQDVLPMAEVVALSTDTTPTQIVPTTTHTDTATQRIESTPTPTVTYTATATPSVTPTVTLGITRTPTMPFTPDPMQLTAETPVTSNNAWTPISREFDGVTMMLVPAGAFEMGSKPAEIIAALALCETAIISSAICRRDWYEDELIPDDGHIQTFAPFWIDRTEVSRAQYQMCVDAGACTPAMDSEFSTAPDQPINRVTWVEATAYCAWRDARLPTEAEWEYAARGPDRLIFPWGNLFDGARANHCDGNCVEADWATSVNFANRENDDGYTVTAPVESYADGLANGASWVGTLNMAGNVQEWTSSIYTAYPYDRTDGRESQRDDKALGVLRGGTFTFLAAEVRTAQRYGFNRSQQNNTIGLRCVRAFSGA
jgi:formylglycine-generating enzyme required for sulfatase activity